MKRHAAILSALLFIAMLLCAGCAPKHDDPQVFWGQTPAQAREASRLHAIDLNGTDKVGWFVAADTKSMEPLIVAGDYLAVDTKVPFAAIQRGQVVMYAIGFLSQSPVPHRTQDKNVSGWTMRGDNVPPNAPETFTMTEHDYIGLVMGVYTTRNKP